jgi:alkylhydroperoxidase family enzyme
MTRIPAVNPESVDGDLTELARDPFYGIVAHRPEILEAWSELDKVFFGPSSTVSNAVKEEARRVLAQGVGCVYCASLGVPREDHPDRREALAVAFAELLLTDYRQIEDSTFEVLREEFSEQEIVELVTWLCFKYGSNMFGALMRLSPASEAQVEGYAQFVATG